MSGILEFFLGLILLIFVIAVLFGGVFVLIFEFLGSGSSGNDEPEKSSKKTANKNKQGLASRLMADDIELAAEEQSLSESLEQVQRELLQLQKSMADVQQKRKKIWKNLASELEKSG